MEFLGGVLGEALRLLFAFGSELREVFWLTLGVSAAATFLGVLVGVPLGAWLSLDDSRLRKVLLVAVNTGMGFPPVLAGLLLLLLLWDSGPLGSLGLLFTPTAMIIAQTLLALPIAAGVTAASLRALSEPVWEQLRALRLPAWERGYVAVREARAGVIAAVVAAFGRVVSEVGAVLVVGGNVKGETRVLTTAIVQEARQSDFETALALGILLLGVAVSINGTLTWLQLRGRTA